MTETVAQGRTEALLNTAYKTVKSASELILNLMPKVKDEQLKSDMTVHLSALEAFSSRTVKLLAEENAKPEEESTVTKMSAKLGSMMNTLLDSGNSRLAELMIENATSGVSELTRTLRESENLGVSESALRLSRDVCTFEEKRIQKMKEYL
ncbi:MAG: hypothetical protein E7637_04270 [Ruminococcaceae bacterium]|nr:hypothetical protein [Oscillospiraceae bacterium]